LALERRPLSAPELIDAAVQPVAPLVREKDLTLVRDVPPDLPRFIGDPNKLQRTLVNLLANAVKFTPSGGRITVQARTTTDEEAQEGLVFTVRDTGEGIPEEAFERIFEKFGQVETRKAGRKMSTG